MKPARPRQHTTPAAPAASADPAAPDPALSAGSFTPATTTLVVLCLLMWSSAFAGVRAAAPAYSSGAMALLRFATASLCALTYLIATRAGLPQRRDLPAILIGGLIGFTVYHLLFNELERSIQAGAAAAIIAAAPVFTALLSRIFLRERLGPAALFGIALSFVGVMVISFSSSGVLHFRPHTFLLLICAAATAIYTILAKPLVARYGGVRLTSYMLLAGTVPLLVFLPALARQLPHAALTTTAAVIYMGIFPAFGAYALWNIALAQVSAARLSVFLNAQPLIAVLIAWAWLREHPHPLVYVGGALAIGGIFLVQKKSSESVQTSPSAGALTENPV
jgi:drug/metabolite transporter (DMT)-like permease